MCSNVPTQVTMPRNIAKGNERVAQRVRVLAHKAANPDHGSAHIGRALSISESTVRGILKNWTGDPAVSSNVQAHKGSGRPPKKDQRWRRCNVSHNTHALTLALVLIGNLHALVNDTPSTGLVGWRRRCSIGNISSCWPDLLVRCSWCRRG